MAGHASYFLQRDTLHFGHCLSDYPDEGRLVALSSVRDRGEIRRVGLDEHPIERRLFHHLTKRFCVFKSDDPAKGKIETEIQKLSCGRIVAGKAMDDPFDFARAMVAEQFRDFVMSFAVMNHERKSGLLGHLDEAAEKVHLGLLRRMVVIKIEPGLSHSNDSALTGELLEPAPVFFTHRLGIVGVHADGGKKSGMGLSQRDCRIIAGEITRAAYDNDPLHPRFLRALDDLRDIGGKLGPLDMSVAIDQTG